MYYNEQSFLTDMILQQNNLLKLRISELEKQIEAMKLNITYNVRKLEDGFSGSHISQEHEFKNLEEAIIFHKSQPKEEYSWWEILVSYT